MNQQFSVSMCVYAGDNPEYFKLAVDSILNQSVVPDEVVLVVDGPVPKMLDEIISEYESYEVFHVIRLSENQGHGNARRIALNNCKYELVALMDADDISVPDRFEKQLLIFSENPSLSIVGGHISEFINTPENAVGIRKVPQSDEAIKKYMKKRCPMNQMTVMLRKSIVEQAGGYLEWYCDEDYYLWIRLFLKKAIFANIDTVLVNVRVGYDMYKRRGGWKYYRSEARLQKFMLNNKVISFPIYFINVSIRMVIQVLLPNKVRAWVFRRIAREKAK